VDLKLDCKIPVALINHKHAYISISEFFCLFVCLFFIMVVKV